MAKAGQQTAPTFVSLKAISDELQIRAGESTRGVKRAVVALIADGHYRHRGSKEPPPGFWHGHPDIFILDGSDITNAVCDDGCAFTLHGVSLAWEKVVAAYPELGSEPPRLGTSRVEVTAEPSLMRWLEALVAMLWTLLPQRAAPEAKQDPQRWFDQALKDHQQAPGERDAHYIDRLHELMKVAPVTKVWERGTLERRLYEGRKAGDSRGSK